MSEAAVWAVIFSGMLATYSTRLSFILLVPPERLPSSLRRGLRYVFPSVLAALILPELLSPGGQIDASPENPRLLAGLLAALVAWRIRNTWLTIAIGMLSLWVFSAL